MRIVYKCLIHTFFLGDIKTSFLSGSSFNVTWHLAYPHRVSKNSFQLRSTSCFIASVQDDTLRFFYTLRTQPLHQFFLKLKIWRSSVNRKHGAVTDERKFVEQLFIMNNAFVVSYIDCAISRHFYYQAKLVFSKFCNANEHQSKTALLQ